MSQSWGNVASMHDHLLILITVHAHPLVPCACADGSGYRGHTPPTKCAMATFSLCPNIVTGLLTGMTKNRPRLSLRSRRWVTINRRMIIEKNKHREDIIIPTNLVCCTFGTAIPASIILKFHYLFILGYFLLIQVPL